MTEIVDYALFAMDAYNRGYNAGLGTTVFDAVAEGTISSDAPVPNGATVLIDSLDVID